VRRRHQASSWAHDQRVERSRKLNFRSLCRPSRTTRAARMCLCSTITPAQCLDTFSALNAQAAGTTLPLLALQCHRPLYLVLGGSKSKVASAPNSISPHFRISVASSPLRLNPTSTICLACIISTVGFRLTQLSPSTSLSPKT